jgi:uncharacterized membrane protein YGL010W
MTVLLVVLGAALIVAGIVLLHRCWSRTAPSWGVIAGWVLIDLGLVAFMASVRPAYGLALGALVAMAVPLALVLSPLSRGWTPKPPRESERPAAVPPGGRSRSIARLVGSLLAAPAFALAAALAWRALVPGSEVDRLAGAAYAAPIAFAIALVVVMGAGRPWRATGMLAAATALAVAPVFLPRLIGA